MVEEGEDCQVDGETGDVKEDGDFGFALHFIHCIVQDKQKADANVFQSCLEAAMHALKHRLSRATMPQTWLGSPPGNFCLISKLVGY